MNKDELWTEIMRQNPAMSTSEFVRLRRADLRRMFDLAYDRGLAEGRKTAPGAGVRDMFEQVFGKKSF